MSKLPIEMEWKEKFEFYLDEKGFPGNAMIDGSLEFGDSTQRLGMLLLAERYGKYDILPISHETYYFWVMRGEEPTRHWNPEYWTGQPGCMSRDNMFPLICGSKLFAKGFHTRLKRRKYFCWNNRDLEGKLKSPPIVDWAGPVVWGAIERSIKEDNANTLKLYFTDTLLLLQAINLVVQNKVRHEHTSDNLNFDVAIKQSQYVKPTLLSKLASKIYYKFRRNDAFKSYFRTRSKFVPPPIHELYTHWEKREGLNT